ncbi:MAG: DUF308 domain-containing protein [Lachnospiraceae bacterium]|nr:DUF308 domain-containing protein [Lachnospiraceae bacterium]
MSKENKSSRTPYLLLSAIAFIALGVAAIMFSGPIAGMIDNIIKWVVAVILGIIAIIDIIAFAKDRSKENIKNLVIGILALVAAVVLIVMPNLLVIVIGVLLGLYLIVEGFFKVKAAFNSKKGDTKGWFVPLIFGIVSIILGCLIIYFGIRPFAILKIFVIVVGIMLIYAGIQNFVNLFFNKKN